METCSPFLGLGVSSDHAGHRPSGCRHPQKRRSSDNCAARGRRCHHGRREHDTRPRCRPLVFPRQAQHRRLNTQCRRGKRQASSSSPKRRGRRHARQVHAHLHRGRGGERPRHGTDYWRLYHHRVRVIRSRGDHRADHRGARRRRCPGSNRSRGGRASCHYRQAEEHLGQSSRARCLCLLRRHRCPKPSLRCLTFIIVHMPMSAEKEK
mmetsp:Transcript_28307/g.78161  ORF Transcript_28307/g.78161 Transcript_28307/m.78161 type:complete len:208 (+) Transcript_28307:282-905(+)